MDCPKLKEGFPCHRCDLPISKSETGLPHDCLKALKEKVAKQKGLELTNKVLAEKVKQLISLNRQYKEKIEAFEKAQPSQR